MAYVSCPLSSLFFFLAWLAQSINCLVLPCSVKSGKRPWVVQDEIDKGKIIMGPCKNDGMPPWAKLPYRNQQYGEEEAEGWCIVMGGLADGAR